MKKIGIDLGSHTIKISTVNESVSGLHLGARETYPAVGSILEKEYFVALKEYIEAFSDKYNLSTMDASFTLSSTIEYGTSTHVITLPTSNEDVLNKAVKFEIKEQEIIKNLGDFHYTWEMLAAQDDEEDSFTHDEDSDVVIAAINKRILYEIAQLRKPRFKVSSIELQSSTYGRYLDKNEDAIVVDFGYDKTSIYLYVNGFVSEIDTIETGGRQLTEIVMNELDSPSFNVAEEIKEKAEVRFGISEEYQFGKIEENTKNVLTEEIEDMFSEITRVIRGFEMGSDVQFNKIYYTGGTTNLKNFPQLMRLNFEYEVVDISEIIPLESEIISEEGIVLIDDSHEEIEPLLETDDLDLFGEDEELSRVKSRNNKEKISSLFKSLAQKVKKEDSKDSTYIIETSFDAIEDVNIFSAAYLTLEYDTEPYLEKLEFHKYLKFMIDYTSWIIAATTFSLILTVGVRTVSRRYDDRINSVSSSVTEGNTKVSSLNSDIQSLESQIKDSEEFIDKVENLKDVKKWYSEVLFEIPEITPDGVVVEDISINEGEVVIKGYSTNYTQIGAFAIGLETLGESEIETVNEMAESSIYVTDIVSTDQVKPELRITKSYEIILKKH